MIPDFQEMLYLFYFYDFGMFAESNAQVLDQISQHKNQLIINYWQD